ncbi:MAG: hypothetical protein ACREJF_02130 [Candidatus Methylomirabilales bacterium]
MDALFLLSMAVWESGALHRQRREGHKMAPAHFHILGRHSPLPHSSLDKTAGRTARHDADDHLNPKEERKDGE